MVNCDNFVHFMVEDEEDLTHETREARESHATSCERCSRLMRGYRAYVSRKRTPREEIGTDAPWVKESLVRAANARFDRLEVAERERVLSRNRPRARALALASAAAVLLASGFPAASELVLVSSKTLPPSNEEVARFERETSKDQPLTRDGISVIPSNLKTTKKGN
jgi:hypothetical protein